MGWTKRDLTREIIITVEHPLYDGEFTFYLDAGLPPAARRASVQLFGLPDADRDREGYRLAVEMLAALATREPGGFNDFPADERPLADRMREYFADERMEAFVSAALNQYWSVALPRAYLRRAANGHQADVVPLQETAGVASEV